MFDKFAQVAKALASTKRLEILEHLAQGQRSVDALAQLLGSTLANTSQHLKCLRSAGMVVSKKEGKYVFCRLSGDSVIDLMSALQRTSEEHVAEVQEIVSSYFSKCDNMEALSRQQLIERIDTGLVTILDVRPANEFNMAHLPGAINIPLKQLSDRLSELQKIKRSLPTAGAHFVSSHLRQSLCCEKKGSRQDVWKTAIQNGRQMASQLYLVVMIFSGVLSYLDVQTIALI